ncbi:unnamed protein product [Jaminaea pallidilutea]
MAGESSKSKDSEANSGNQTSKDAGSTASSKGNKGDKAGSGSATPANPTPGNNNNGDDGPAAPSSSSISTAAVLQYLKSRGFERPEAVLTAELEALAAGQSPEAAQAAGIAAVGPAAARTMTLNELANKSAPRDVLAPGDKDKGPGPLETLAAEALKVDRTDRIRGFGMVRNWCEGGLDVYQSELRPLLLPLFVHAYLDLIELNLDTAAFSFYSLHSSALLPQHLSLMSHLRSITLRTHMYNDDLVQRFRSERYVLKMSQTVFGLLLGWLTDGTGPVAMAGAADGVGGGDAAAEGPATRGRLAMLRIINERCRIQVLRAKPYELTSTNLEEGTGLTGAGPSYSASGRASRAYPALQANAVSEGGDAIAEFNAKSAGPQLKLGPQLPMNERLKEEVDKEVSDELQAERLEEEQKRRQREASSERPQETASKEEDAQESEEAMEGVERGEDGDGADGASSRRGKRSKSKEASATPARGTSVSTPAPGSSKAATATAAPAAKDAGTTSATTSDLLQPTAADLPPQAPLFRTVDIMREVAKVRDARKRLRIDLDLLKNDKGESSSGLGTTDLMRRAALPSICAYTYHDVQDGLTCSTFSEDLSLMAAGFEESYVQVWSLKGDSLRSLRGDFSVSDVRDANTLGKQRDPEDEDEDDKKHNTVHSTRKLIGHSAPVYSVSFDTIGGSASSPRTLLSASGDATVRLWSMDTLSALVSYRGHQGPVWDVDYSPASIYFATAGMDKTARLWSTERINPLRMYVGHLSDVDCLSFHPNSLYLATGSSDRTARLWDVQRGACVRLFVGHSSPVSAVKVSPDGRYLATVGSGMPGHMVTQGAEDEASISLWDLGSGRRIKKMWGHSSRVHSLDFSADGGLLITGSDDCTVRCWDVKSAGGSALTTGNNSAHRSGVVLSDSDRDAGAAANSEAGAAQGASKSTAAAGVIPGSGVRVHDASSDCVATFRTKKTPMMDVKVTRRNLCLVAGAYDDSL